MISGNGSVAQVTALRTGARALGDADGSALAALIAQDPVGQCVFAARLRQVNSLSPTRLGGQVWGIGGDDRALRAACFAGGNLIPLGGDGEAVAALAVTLSRHRRTWSSVVGRAEAVHALWSEIGHSWGIPRAIRWAQPLLTTSTLDVVPDPYVRRVGPRELEAYLPAALAMFSEELGIKAPASGADSPYRNRISQLISAGLAFVRFDARGEVVFKAEIAAVSRDCCQVQGVWVHPRHRGRGIGTAGMAAVIQHGLTLAPQVSLYVNDYNTSARRMYAKLGMRQVGTFTTILF